MYPSAGVMLYNSSLDENLIFCEFLFTKISRCQMQIDIKFDSDSAAAQLPAIQAAISILDSSQVKLIIINSLL